MSYEDYITIFSANHQQVKSFTECKKKFHFLCPNLLQDVGLPISALSRAKKIQTDSTSAEVQESC